MEKEDEWYIDSHIILVEYVELILQIIDKLEHDYKYQLCLLQTFPDYLVWI